MTTALLEEGSENSCCSLWSGIGLRDELIKRIGDTASLHIQSSTVQPDDRDNKSPHTASLPAKIITHNHS